MATPRLALVGCGAICEAFYIPALQKRPDLLDSLILVDKDVDRTEALGARTGAAAVVSDHLEIVDRVDGAIIATPHHLHAPLSLDFAQNGVHVLSEKPLAAAPADVDRLIEVSTDDGVTISVNHTRRLSEAIVEARRMARGGSIGELRSFDRALARSSGDRPRPTPTSARPPEDAACSTTSAPTSWTWRAGSWAEPRSSSIAATTREGGTEAVVNVRLRRGEMTADVHLSWLSELENTYRVSGTEGQLEGRIFNGSVFTKTDAAGQRLANVY